MTSAAPIDRPVRLATVGERPSGHDLRVLGVRLGRQLWVVALCTLLGGAGALAYVLTRSGSYAAQAQVLLKPGDPAESASGTPSNDAALRDPDRYAQSQRAILLSPAVLDAAAQRLGARTLPATVDVSPVAGTDILAVKATGSSATSARDSANAVSAAYIENRRVAAVQGLQRAADEIKPQLDQLQSQLVQLNSENPRTPAIQARIDATTLQYQSMFERLQQLNLSISLQRGEAEIIRPADTPAATNVPGKVKAAAGGAAAGLVVGVAFAALRARADDRLRTRADVEFHGFHVLGSIPRERRHGRVMLVAARDPRSHAAEGYRTVRSSLQFLRTGAKTYRVAIASATAGDENATVVANLGVTFARAKSPTLVVAADLRRPRLAAFFGESADGVGLTDMIDAWPERRPDGRIVHDERAVPVHLTFERHLYLLPPGSRRDNPSEVLASPLLPDVLQRADGGMDVVLYDTAPTPQFTDAALVARNADGVVLVARANRTTARGLRDMAAVFDAAQVPVLGVVLFNTKSSDSARGRS
jgi:capsular exopolysaccharide synthesis family protein